MKTTRTEHKFKSRLRHDTFGLGATPSLTQFTACLHPNSEPSYAVWKGSRNLLVQVQVTAWGDSLREPRPALSAGNPLDTAWGMHPSGASTGLQLQSLLQQWGSSATCDCIARGRHTTAQVMVRTKGRNSRTPQRALLLFRNKPSLPLVTLHRAQGSFTKITRNNANKHSDIFSWLPHYKIMFYFGCSQVLSSTMV